MSLHGAALSAENSKRFAMAEDDYSHSIDGMGYYSLRARRRKLHRTVE